MILLMESDITNERFIISAENYLSGKYLPQWQQPCKRAPYKKASPYMA